MRSMPSPASTRVVDTPSSATHASRSTWPPPRSTVRSSSADDRAVAATRPRRVRSVGRVAAARGADEVVAPRRSSSAAPSPSIRRNDVDRGARARRAARGRTPITKLMPTPMAMSSTRTSPVRQPSGSIRLNSTTTNTVKNAWPTTKCTAPGVYAARNVTIGSTIQSAVSSPPIDEDPRSRPRSRGACRATAWIAGDPGPERVRPQHAQRAEHHPEGVVEVEQPSRSAPRSRGRATPRTAARKRTDRGSSGRAMRVRARAPADGDGRGSAGRPAPGRRRRRRR